MIVWLFFGCALDHRSRHVIFDELAAFLVVVEQEQQNNSHVFSFSLTLFAVLATTPRIDSHRQNFSGNRAE